MAKWATSRHRAVVRQESSERLPRLARLSLADVLLGAAGDGNRVRRPTARRRACCQPGCGGSGCRGGAYGAAAGGASEDPGDGKDENDPLEECGLPLERVGRWRNMR